MYSYGFRYLGVTLGKYPNYLHDPFDQHKEIARVCSLSSSCILQMQMLMFFGVFSALMITSAIFPKYAIRKSFHHIYTLGGGVSYRYRFCYCWLSLLNPKFHDSYKYFYSYGLNYTYFSYIDIWMWHLANIQTTCQILMKNIKILQGFVLYKHIHVYCVYMYYHVCICVCRCWMKGLAI